MSCKLTLRRSVRLPGGYAPLHFWGNQRSGRRTAAQGACNCPTIKEVNRHARSVQPSHGCALPQLRRNWWSNSGAQAHTPCNRRVGYRVQRKRTTAYTNVTSSQGCHGILKR
jgi:hypothetical protein